MNLKHGLCVELGQNEFIRRLAEQKRRAAGVQPRKFTGLSLKVLTPAQYMRQYRKLKSA